MFHGTNVFNVWFHQYDAWRLHPQLYPVSCIVTQPQTDCVPLRMRQRNMEPLYKELLCHHFKNQI